MTEPRQTGDLAQSREEPVLRMRLPGFIRDDEVGLGDVVSRVTYVMGLPHCGGCQQRTATLNRWITFTR